MLSMLLLIMLTCILSIRDSLGSLMRMVALLNRLRRNFLSLGCLHYKRCQMCEHAWISHHGLLVCHPRLVKLHMGSSLRINGGYYAWSTSQLLWCLYGLKRVVSILNCLITSWNSLLPSNLPLFVTQMRVQSLCITSTWPNISIVFLSSSLMSHLCQTIIRLYISQNF